MHPYIQNSRLGAYRIRSYSLALFFTRLDMGYIIGYNPNFHRDILLDNINNVYTDKTLCTLYFVCTQAMCAYINLLNIVTRFNTNLL